MGRRSMNSTVVPKYGGREEEERAVGWHLPPPRVPHPACSPGARTHLPPLCPNYFRSRETPDARRARRRRRPPRPRLIHCAKAADETSCLRPVPRPAPGLHGLHGNRGGGHGSWAPARHPAPRWLQAPGLRPPRRRGPRGLSSEFSAPAPPCPRPRPPPCDSAGSPPAMAHLGTSALGYTSVPRLWHAGCATKHVPNSKTGTCAARRHRGALCTCDALGSRPILAHNSRAVAKTRPPEAKNAGSGESDPSPAWVTY
ncbi:keratinocyte proline-rich protein-like [Cynocephalus volans]|uniref:keratinocyte proline-rich protein-like n=1 Tax=Cynocephalus volans TaxID=110931 RepID=UPI002FC61A9B